MFYIRKYRHGTKKNFSLQALICLKKAKATDVLILTLFYFKLILFSYSIYEWNAIVSLLIVNRNISFQRYKGLGKDFRFSRHTEGINTDLQFNFLG